jgi:hypothetical protein
MSQRGHVPQLMARGCSGLKMVDRLAMPEKGGTARDLACCLHVAIRSLGLRPCWIYQTFTNPGSPSCRFVLSKEDRNHEGI